MSKNVIPFPAEPKSVEALIAESEAVHRAQEGDRQILAQLAIELEGEAQALADHPESVSSVIRNLAHNAGHLRSIVGKGA